MTNLRQMRQALNSRHNWERKNGIPFRFQIIIMKMCFDCHLFISFPFLMAKNENVIMESNKQSENNKNKTTTSKKKACDITFVFRSSKKKRWFKSYNDNGCEEKERAKKRIREIGKKRTSWSLAKKRKPFHRLPTRPKLAEENKKVTAVCSFIWIALYFVLTKYQQHTHTHTEGTELEEQGVMSLCLSLDSNIRFIFGKVCVVVVVVERIGTWKMHGLSIIDTMECPEWRRCSLFSMRSAHQKTPVTVAVSAMPNTRIIRKKYTIIDEKSRLKVRSVWSVTIITRIGAYVSLYMTIVREGRRLGVLRNRKEIISAPFGHVHRNGATGGVLANMTFKANRLLSISIYLYIYISIYVHVYTYIMYRNTRMRIQIQSKRISDVICKCFPVILTTIFPPFHRIDIVLSVDFISAHIFFHSSLHSFPILVSFTLSIASLAIWHAAPYIFHWISTQRVI